MHNGDQFVQNTDPFRVTQTLSCSNAMARHQQGQVSVKYDANQTKLEPILIPTQLHPNKQIDFNYFFKNKDEELCKVTNCEFL